MLVWFVLRKWSLLLAVENFPQDGEARCLRKPPRSLHGGHGGHRMWGEFFLFFLGGGKSWKQLNTHPEWFTWKWRPPGISEILNWKNSMHFSGSVTVVKLWGCTVYDFVIGKCGMIHEKQFFWSTWSFRINIIFSERVVYQQAIPEA